MNLLNPKKDPSADLAVLKEEVERREAELLSAIRDVEGRRHVNPNLWGDVGDSNAYTQTRIAESRLLLETKTAHRNEARDRYQVACLAEERRRTDALQASMARAAVSMNRATWIMAIATFVMAIGTILPLFRHAH